MTQRSILSRIASGFLLALIATFAITTMGNVADFVHRYHAGWTGWTLGAAFGVTVFLSSWIAATASTKRTRRISLCISIAFALSSAFFQVDLYLDGGAPMMTAMILAFVPITIGEAGLALLESNYSRDHEVAQDALLSEQLRAQVDELLAEIEQAQAVDGMQLSAIAQMELRIDALAVALEDAQADAQSLQSELVQSRETVRNLDARNAQLQARLDAIYSQPVAKAEPAQPQQLVDASAISDSQLEILRVIVHNPQMQQKDIADATGKSTTAISRQLKPLKDGGIADFDGGVWRVHPQAIAQLNGKLAKVKE